MGDNSPKKPFSDMRKVQIYTAGRIVDEPALMLSMGMGIGKTVSTLTAMRWLLDTFQVNHILVIAPLLVAEETWPDEIEKWEHTEVLNYEVLTGPEERRIARAKMLPEISIINTENVSWLVEFWGEDWPYDTVFIDESSRFKNHSVRNKPTKKAVENKTKEVIASLPRNTSPDDVEAILVKALKKLPKPLTRFGSMCKTRPYIDRIYDMTGTIAPNGLLDLWSQYYLLDQGERLGRNISAYRSRYFEKDYTGFKYIPRPGAFDNIMDRIKDITISMRTEDYADMPKSVYNQVKVHLPDKVMEKYRKFERTLLYEAAEQDIEAVNSGVLTGKLLQLANGCMYYDEDEYIEIHDKKLQALDEIIESANGQPVLIAYSYEFDLVKLRKKYPKAELAGERPNLQKRWNNGEIPILLAHPQSAGHGLNLQYGGFIIIWYGLCWSLEYYQQLNRRLERPGQPETVFIHHLIAVGTVDERVMEVLPDKAATQDAVVEATLYRPE